ncbi:hypothetical protein V1J52_09475 [Streptomyces sp. TRM 70351]|uniref:hypothetical protein n=1 Tax=Streptomyces sp. TRM 70351 TaxID=3116552 RepID=UPI002E7B3BF5|nr:hypothetical protein [Streptomyces sp. TRM 70351]MEE1928418.1 hypothetical protein [Streptomyces sp. TRM 70351]
MGNHKAGGRYGATVRALAAAALASGAAGAAAAPAAAEEPASGDPLCALLTGTDAGGDAATVDLGERQPTYDVGVGGVTRQICPAQEPGAAARSDTAVRPGAAGNGRPLLGGLPPG